MISSRCYPARVYLSSAREGVIIINEEYSISIITFKIDEEENYANMITLYSLEAGAVLKALHEFIPQLKIPPHVKEELKKLMEEKQGK